MRNNENNIRSFRQGRGKLFLKKNKWNICLLAVIFLVGCFLISKKQGYHMDELLSFELANAEFTPWIVTTQPEGRLEKFVKNEIYADSFGEMCANLAENVKDVLQNRGNSKMLSYKADVYEEPVWILAKQFRDYITTDGKDSFNYLSVYFNVKDDNHPPLHFMALHTISSIFRGKISPWMGCSINLVLILGICILLLRICREFFGQEGQDELGWAVCILYVFSMAGIATLLLIRMYAMLTFFCMAALYLHLKKRKTGQWRTHNKLLIFVTVCGFLTQYYFVLFMLFLAGVTMAFLWKTEKKHLLFYFRTMAISALLGLCIFPFSMMDVLYSERGVESVRNLGGGFSGLSERLFYFLLILKEQVLGGNAGLSIFLLVAMATLIRMLWIKLWQDEELAKAKKVEREKARKSNVVFRWNYYMICVPCFGYFLIVVKIAPYYADRYLMPVFPLFALLIGLLFRMGLNFLKENLRFLKENRKRLKKNRKPFSNKGWLVVLAVLMVLPNISTQAPAYWYQGYALQEGVSKQYADSACLCVYEGVGYYQNLVEFTNYKETLMVTKEELLMRSKDEVLEKEAELVVLMKNNVNQTEVEQYLAEEYGFSPVKDLLQESVHQDTVRLFRKS